MTRHLSPEQFVDALEHRLAADRTAHLATCLECANELEDMRSLMEGVTLAGQVPEPSPLFWDHLSARVRDAVAIEPVPMAAAWWHMSWRPLATIGGVLSVLAVVLTVSVWRSAPADGGAGAPAVASTAEDRVPADGSDSVWEMIGTLAPTMPADHAYGTGLQPGRATTEGAIDSLTNAQRVALMKLLRAEMRSSAE